jgi:hypothetical protein
MAYPAPEFVVSPEHLGIDPNQPRISNGRMCGSLTRDPVRLGSIRNNRPPTEQTERRREPVLCGVVGRRSGP